MSAMNEKKLDRRQGERAPTQIRHAGQVLVLHTVNLEIDHIAVFLYVHMTQLCCTDEAIAILVKYAESLLDFLFTICVLHLASHHR